MILIAEILSLAFHPVLFVLTMPFVIVYRQTANSLYALKWEIFSAIFVFLGICVVIFGKHMGLFSDYDLTKRKERHLFYLLIAILSAIHLAASVFFKGIFFPLSIITLGIIVGIAIFELIDYYLKASIHIGVASAWVLTMGILYGGQTLLETLWIVPIIAWSRIVLKKHTVKEIIIGGTLGVTITYITYVVGRYIYALL